MKVLNGISLFLIGTMFGIVLQASQENDKIKKAEKECHQWCDRNSEPNTNLFCKSQCTDIFLKSECLKFPYPD